MTPRIFSQPELSFIEKHAGTMTNKNLHAAFVKKFHRRNITAIQISDACGWRGWPRGRKLVLTPSMSNLQNGSLEIYIDETGEYKQMQRVILGEIVGPIPRGTCMVPINGDKFDYDPFNWLLLTKSMANRLRQSPFFTAPPELRPTIFAAAKLKQTIEDKTGRRLRRDGRNLPSNNSTHHTTHRR